jgi:hypothetical protein
VGRALGTNPKALFFGPKTFSLKLFTMRNMRYLGLLVNTTRRPAAR